MPQVLIGIDPSSRKLAAVMSVLGKESNADIRSKAMPVDKSVACLMAFEWVKTLIEDCKRLGEVSVFIELPVLGRGGPGSTIPQAQINGALIAGAAMADAEIFLVNNARCKKEVIGRGNANKDDIRNWVEENWPDLFQKIGGDQDLCDSAMIYCYGKAIFERRDKIANRKSLEGVSIKRRGKVTDE